ncbi:Hydroxyacylglutathione hydrolase [Gryganskiella cystojenkinii]|nr:Hydroxyacylglutathione hydrolase [Gryganskiella cystojenkinii]
MKSLLVTTAVVPMLFAATMAPAVQALNVEVFQSNKEGHYVHSGIVSSKNSIMIIDAQLSPVYGRHLADRVKALNKTVKAIFITHGHRDHYWGLEELVKVFPKAEIIASQQTVDKMMSESPPTTKPQPLRPSPNSLGLPKTVIIPKVYSRGTYDLDGEKIRLIGVGQGDTEHITCLDIPSKGTLFRSWDAKNKRDSTWVPSNGTYWASDVVFSGIHILMNEVESKSVRKAWSKNAKDIKVFALANNRSVVPGHLDKRHAWTTEQMLDYPIKYLATYEEALKMNTSGKFWDRVMNDYADDGMLFLLDWGMDLFYTSKRKTPVP